MRKYLASKLTNGHFEAIQRAVAAMETGRFREEVVPVAVPQGKGNPLMYDMD